MLIFYHVCFCRKVVEVSTNYTWMVAAKRTFSNQTAKKCTQAKQLARFVYIDCVGKAIDKCYSNYKGIYLLFMQSRLIESTFLCKTIVWSKRIPFHEFSFITCKDHKENC